MIDKRKLELFKEIFDRSQSILIIYSQNATRDQLFAAASFYASLKSTSNKSTKLLCSKDLSKEQSDIAYLEEAQSEIGHENLCIGLDYLENSVDKVSYHVSEETKKFYLTIKPKKGFAPLSKENIDFSYTGAEADLIILVGVDELDSLGKLYFGYENLFNTATLVNINTYETEFGNFKFDISGASSFSEFIFQVLYELQIPIDPESATNLLTGINEETNNFSSFSATADTFYVISKLMKAGARRITKKLKKQQGEQLTNVDKKVAAEVPKNKDLTGSFSPKKITDSQKREKERFRLKKLAKKTRREPL
ncbi:MAG: hypothetical protein COZ34_03300 [Candidatus Pacebacteria bacterium CG_4_10_14_3_um_filter_34_15]|nr:hypothetical protein [Candidatus Pacearchaeota archaeon]NCQ66063.1 hypothetical protein [Candidatus Paceibacterota bacterium]OIO43618.1 MAG: hypothetical protein AUJ41_04580 [Candidatus Pacebacteria bacterium CG1_02_43_31]PIX81477.1 MAG: hypothetical protein COZ34_03300 [Candidatus Pacebacteria bacterium CG_4_10_14_3_um_filter_34_15]PJC43662.1 MAG: hypothetical protein CO039_03125 [Candidatus Pacebacteria bacterium CG_4_9_14_0_2_um_filter_34_50]